MSEAVFTKLSEIHPEPVRWLWEGRVPLGKVTLLEGEPGVGKTTLALDLAARVSRGESMPTGRGHDDEAREPDAANVVIFTGVDGLADTIVPQLVAAGADLNRVFAVDREFEVGDVAAFHPALIVLDTFSSYACLSCDHDPVDVLRKLNRLAKASGAAILALVNSADKPGEAFSPEFYGTPRSALMLTPVGHGGRRLAVSKANLGHAQHVHPLVYYINEHGNDLRIVNWSDGR